MTSSTKNFNAFIDNENEYSLVSVNPEPFWVARNFNLKVRKPYSWFLKRLLDYSLSLTALIIFSPLLIVTAILIKTDSSGPILFKQKRIGRYGNEFNMYKFRSMKNNAEAELDELIEQNETNEGMFKIQEDPRITPIGKFIRKYSIDELPQLINVLRGEMSLVGPRPPLERELEKYQNWHYLRFAALPGLTGIWQVSGRSDITDFNQVVKMDYNYVLKWSVLLDIGLILKTIPVVIKAKGAT